MRRVVLTLDLMEDEADLVAKAVSSTKVRFGGLELSKFLELSRGSLPMNHDGDEFTTAISEGALYEKRRPVRCTYADEITTA